MSPRLYAAISWAFKGVLRAFLSAIRRLTNPHFALLASQSDWPGNADRLTIFPQRPVRQRTRN
jgi:hypothetical protein